MQMPCHRRNPAVSSKSRQHVRSRLRIQYCGLVDISLPRYIPEMGFLRQEKFDTHVIQSAYFLAARGDRCGVHVEEEKSCNLALPRSAAEPFEGARGRSKYPSLILRLETTKAVTSLPYAIFIIIRQICLAVFSLSRL